MTPEAPRRSERTRQPPIRYGFMVTEGGEAEIVDSDDPTTFAEAMGSSDSEKWLKAMNEEMKSMHDNQVWELVDPTPGTMPIGCKWIYKIKHDMDGNPQTYKA